MNKKKRRKEKTKETEKEKSTFQLYNGDERIQHHQWMNTLPLPEAFMNQSYGRFLLFSFLPVFFFPLSPLNLSTDSSLSSIGRESRGHGAGIRLGNRNGIICSLTRSRLHMLRGTFQRGRQGRRSGRGGRKFSLVLLGRRMLHADGRGLELEGRLGLRGGAGRRELGGTGFAILRGGIRILCGPCGHKGRLWGSREAGRVGGRLDSQRGEV